MPPFPFLVSIVITAETSQALCPQVALLWHSGQPYYETSFANQTSTGKLCFTFLISDEAAYIFCKFLQLQMTMIANKMFSLS